jgi:hypothetical protein
MPDYRKMTVESLRDLARERLGPGHTKKAKSELVELLESAPAPKAAAKRPTAGNTRKKAVAASKAAPAKKQAAKPPAKPSGRKAAAPARKPAARETASAAPPEEGAPGAEGYFVARVRGEEAVRDAPHPLTETGEDAPRTGRGEDPGPARPDEGLGELPWGYGDDTFVALPRDPRTLFVFWDFAAETTAGAFAGLDGPRAELRVLVRAGAGWEQVRSIEFALESHGFYVHDLDPGRVYRAEIHAVDRRGTRRPVGRSSNEMMLPPLGPSPVIDDRFIRIPWDMPLGRLLGPGHAGGPFSDEARALLARLSDWSRFGGGGGSIGGIGGRGGNGPLGSGSGSGAGPLGGSGAGRGT